MPLTIRLYRSRKFIIPFLIIIILLGSFVIFQSLNNYFDSIKQSNLYLQRQSSKLNSSFIHRAILIFYPSNQESHYLPEIRWLYRSWVEMMKYESKNWRTDLIIYTGEYSSSFQQLGCILNQIRINNTEQPQCRVFLYLRLSMREISSLTQKQTILANQGKKTQQQQQQNELLHPSEITSLHKPNPDLKCGIVSALDRDPIFEIPGVHIIDDWNLTEETTNDCNKRLQDLLNRLKINKVDGILSDMCPNVTGCKEIDHSAIVVLQRQALHFARRLLKKNGYFLCKLFQGQETFQEMRSLLESLFHIVHLVKPSASRYQSPEMYLLAMQYHADSSDISLNTDNNNQRIETKRNEIEKLLAEARRIRTKKNDK
ncbi:unnamed protein product [Rotaria sp. Silwood2]|nr:unnamed protein product [Rotaria sp. Silwood2]